MVAAPACPELSFVIPVYNAAQTIAAVVAEIGAACSATSYEVVLVNDGSADDTQSICAGLAAAHPENVVAVELARNFGEHNAVLAGLHFARGNYVVVLDDDGQHPAAEALRLYAAIRGSAHDVVYGRYADKQHSRLRNLGSWLNDHLATLMLKKPRGLYLSSFKVMNRFLVEAIKQNHAATPYVDGLIYRTTRNIAQIDVEHRPRLGGASNYSWRRLLSVWLTFFLSFSILPLRAAGALGFICSGLSGILMLLVIIDKLWVRPDVPVGVPTILCTVVFFAGIQLLILGVVGEYLGRLFFDHSGAPQFVVRTVHGGNRSAA